MSIGKHAPIPNQTAVNVPKIKTVVATGRRNGFWNLLMFSINGTVINPTGTAAISKTPNSLLGTVLNNWKTGKKYHSGKISNGVANGFAGSPIAAGSKTARPTSEAILPRITTGKIYNRSFGQAG